MTYRLPIILLGLTIASGTCAQSEVPPFVAKLITQYKSASPSSSPGAVWKYRYKGAVVFYVPRLACCDIMSNLYDINGNLICHPDGGFAGSGDGRCSSFLAERKDGQQLWSDIRFKKAQ
jgi:hypothetical protein